MIHHYDDGCCLLFSGFKGLYRVNKAAKALEMVHGKLLPQNDKPHWTLLSLVVKPELRRRGLGSEVILPIIRLSDEATLPIYTFVYHYESKTKENKLINFLKRQGFDVRENIAPANGPPFTVMIRYGN